MLGARIAIRMLARGAQPSRAIIAGQGIDSVIGTAAHGANHRALSAYIRGDELEFGSPEADTAQWSRNSALTHELSCSSSSQWLRRPSASYTESKSPYSSSSASKMAS